MRRALLPLTVTLVIGCGLEPLPLDESCPESRLSSRGECCPAWSAPGKAGCAERRWSLPAADAGLGEAGAQWVAVAVDGLGQPAATWVEVNETSARVVVAESAGEGAGAGATGGAAFALRSPSQGLTGRSVQSDIATGPDGAAMVSWKQQFPGEGDRVFVSEREPDGAWKDPVSDQESFSFLPTAYQPRVVFFPDGERLVVWNQWMSTGYGVAVANKRPAGEWQLPASADDVLSPHFLFSNSPQPAVNARGDAVIGWYQSDGAALLAWQSERFGYDGTFSKPTPDDYLSVRDAPIDSHPTANPKPALASDGTAAMVWTQENGKGAVLVYLATRTPEGAWTKPASLDDALSPKLGYARCAQVAFAPSGDLFVVWYQDTGNGNQVLAAHRTPDGEWLEPGETPTVLSTAGSEAIYPALAVGAEGSVLAVWSEKRGETWVIAARRRGVAGAEWGPVEVLSPINGGSAAQPAAAIGGPGDVAVVGWSQGNGTGDRAFFATVEAE